MVKEKPGISNFYQNMKRKNVLSGVIQRQSTTEEILISRGFRRESTTEELIKGRNFCRNQV